MTADVIKIPIPKSELQFDIAGKVYTLSLADKSRAAINTQYQQIEALEVANNQHMTELQHKLVEELGSVSDTASDAQADNYKFRVNNKYEKLFDKAAEKSEEIGREQYLPFLDTLFGENAGSEIYASCGQNIVAVSKVIGVIMVNLNKENQVDDYMAEYAKSLEAMKAQAEGGAADESNGEA